MGEREREGEERGRERGREEGRGEGRGSRERRQERADRLRATHSARLWWATQLFVTGCVRYRTNPVCLPGIVAARILPLAL